MSEGQDLEMSRPWPFGAAVALLTGKSRREIVLFLVVGLTNTLLCYVVYLALLRFVHYTWAYTGAFLFGLVFTGLMNIRVTFSHHPTASACFVFAAYYGLYYAFSLLVLHVFVAGFGTDEHYAMFLMLPVVVPINFVMMRLIVHRFGRALT